MTKSLKREREAFVVDPISSYTRGTGIRGEGDKKDYRNGVSFNICVPWVCLPLSGSDEGSYRFSLRFVRRVYTPLPWQKVNVPLF